MANWEFFLQTIGETQWLRLDSTQPELPSGCYRFAARAPHHAKEVIEVEIKTRQTQDSITRSQTHKHACQLDANGFGIVVEEIELTPGYWEMQCRKELINALTEPDWEIQLSPRVTLPLHKATAALAVIPKGELATTEEEPLENLRSRLVNDADEILEELVSDVFSRVEAKLPAETNSELSPYSLRLDEESFSAALDKPILISGAITSAENAPSREFRLNIILRDPRTATVVAQLSPRIFASSFPFPFCCSLSLRHPCHTYLLQGEVTLTEVPSSQVLAYQTLTVTANWEQLEPLLVNSPALLSSSEASYQSWRGIFPPRLTAKKRGNQKKSPQLPNLPNTIVREKPHQPKKEYVWSKPDDTVAEDSPTLQWELIPELVITSEETKT